MSRSPAGQIATARNIKPQAALSVAYGAGLRGNEVCRGKGAKDRYAMLSPVVVQRLRAQWRVGNATAGCCPAVGYFRAWIRWTR